MFHVSERDLWHYYLESYSDQFWALTSREVITKTFMSEILESSLWLMDSLRMIGWTVGTETTPHPHHHPRPLPRAVHSASNPEEMAGRHRTVARSLLAFSRDVNRKNERFHSAVPLSVQPFRANWRLKAAFMFPVLILKEPVLYSDVSVPRTCYIYLLQTAVTSQTCCRKWTDFRFKNWKSELNEWTKWIHGANRCSLLYWC